MELKVIATSNAPAAIGPYSQAIQIGNMIFTSGQIPILPESGEVVSDDLEAQTRQVLQNLQAVLVAGGSNLGCVVKTTVFLADMNDFAVMNHIYEEYFASHRPARSCVQVARLPKSVRIEIEAIAVTGSVERV